jgi:streptogramin lyase
VDSEGRVWFGEYYSDKVGMFDSKTEKFKEWTVPTPWLGPYPAKADKNGDVWTSGMGADLVDRIDRKTGKITEYMLPTVNANIRHIDIDDASSPVAVWVAEVHQGKIARIEPLD